MEKAPDFAETVELCLKYGPEKLKRFSKASKLIVNIFICVTQFGLCCIYFVFASSSMKQVKSSHNTDVESLLCFDIFQL